jgi:phosphatidylinositol-3-phosphatase
MELELKPSCDQTSRAQWIQVFVLLSLITLTGMVLAELGPSLHNPPMSNKIDAPPSGSPFDYLVVILMENKNFNAINGNAPYLNQLASSYSLATNYAALDHPSLPNYLALTAASTFGCSGYDGAPNSNSCTSTAWGSQNIIDRTVTAGLTWKAYMESMPSNCYNQDSGTYVVRHDPFVYYSDIVTNQTRCNRIVPTTSPTDVELINDLGSSSTASNFMWLTPNVCDDMHDCSIATGDTYLSQVVPKILRSNVFQTQKAALLITFDEGTTSSPPDLVYTVWAGPVVKRSYQSSVAYNHYSVPRTLESAWNLPALTANDASASAMTEFFTSPQQSALKASFSMSQNNVQTSQRVSFTGTATGGTPPYSYNWNFGDGNTAIGSSTAHSYQSANNFTAALTVTDTAGSIATFSQTVTVVGGGTQSPIVSIPVLYLGSAVIAIGLLVITVLAVKRRRAKEQISNP